MHYNVFDRQKLPKDIVKDIKNNPLSDNSESVFLLDSFSNDLIIVIIIIQ